MEKKIKVLNLTKKIVVMPNGKEIKPFDMQQTKEVLHQRVKTADKIIINPNDKIIELALIGLGVQDKIYNIKEEFESIKILNTTGYPVHITDTCKVIPPVDVENVTLGITAIECADVVLIDSKTAKVAKGTKFIEVFYKDGEYFIEKEILDNFQIEKNDIVEEEKPFNAEKFAESLLPKYNELWKGILEIESFDGSYIETLRNIMEDVKKALIHSLITGEECNINGLSTVTELIPRLIEEVEEEESKH